MITHLHIENFQSHRDTQIDLGPGTNVIVGMSDSGKTAIVRALRWVVFNRPSGTSFRSRWGGDTRVTITLYSGVIVSRVRTSTKNHYELRRGRRLEVLEAVGKDVPEPVAEALNLPELCWQWQLDPPFMLSESSSDVARILNEVVNLGDIDLSLQNINRTIRSTQTDLEHANGRLFSLEEEKKSLPDMVKLAGLVERVRASDEVVGNHQDRKRGLYTALESIQSWQKALDRWSGLEELRGKVDRVLQINADIQGLATRRTRIDQLLQEVGRARQLMSGPDLKPVAKKVTEIEELSTRVSNLRERFYRLKDMASAIAQHRQRMEDSETDLESSVERWNREAPKTCPQCGSPLPRMKRG